MAQSPIEQAKLLEGMMKDLSQAEATQSSTEMGRGSVEAPGTNDKRSFRPKAIRIKGKVLAQKELADAQKTMDQAIQYLTENQQFKNQSDRNAFKHELTKKMNQFQLDMLRQGAQMEFEFKKRGLERSEQEAMISMFSDAVSGASMAAIGFSKSKKSGGMGSDGGANTTNASMFEQPSSQYSLAEGYGSAPSPTPSSPYDSFNTRQFNPSVSPDPNKAKSFQDSFRKRTS